jgi:lipoprotein-anchoring transpeptidase ErfK/SrfK
MAPPKTHKSHLGGIALAAAVLLGALAAPQSAKAEGLVDFLWGGGNDYGGGRHVVSFSPQYKPGQVIVSFSDRRLYFITKQGQALTYPVAVPTGEARWQGTTFVSDKKINPAWTPTPEMVRKNPRLPSWVPGGHPMNPLGVRAMYLGSSSYRIHGTDAPWTIGQAVSHGCIRMTNQDVLDLYPRIPVGTRVTVTWQKFSSSAIASNDSGTASTFTDENGAPKRKYYRTASTSKRTTIPAHRTEVQRAAEAQ